MDYLSFDALPHFSFASLHPKLKQNSIKAKIQLFTKALTFILENAGLQSNLGHDVLKVGVYRSTIL